MGRRRVIVGRRAGPRARSAEPRQQVVPGTGSAPRQHRAAPVALASLSAAVASEFFVTQIGA